MKLHFVLLRCSYSTLHKRFYKLVQCIYKILHRVSGSELVTKLHADSGKGKPINSKLKGQSAFMKHVQVLDKTYWELIKVGVKVTRAT